jgi:hypothetical protein
LLELRTCVTRKPGASVSDQFKQDKLGKPEEQGTQGNRQTSSPPQPGSGQRSPLTGSAPQSGARSRDQDQKLERDKAQRKQSRKMPASKDQPVPGADEEDPGGTE